MRIAPDNSGATVQRIEILNNRITDIIRQGILMAGRSLANLNAVIDANTVGTQALPVGQSNRRGVEIESQTSSTVNVKVNNNGIVHSGTSGSNSALAIRSQADNLNGTNSVINATVTGNTIGNTNSGINDGRFRAQTVLEARSMCLDLRSNTLENSSKLFELQKATSGTFGRLTSGNTGTISETATVGSFSSVASCLQPAF
jgi:hypothetical protein